MRETFSFLWFCLDDYYRLVLINHRFADKMNVSAHYYRWRESIWLSLVYGRCRHAGPGGISITRSLSGLAAIKLLVLGQIEVWSSLKQVLVESAPPSSLFIIEESHIVGVPYGEGPYVRLCMLEKNIGMYGPGVCLTSTTIVFPPSLLANPSPQAVKEFESSIFKKDYTYFLGNIESVRQEELSELAYQTCQTSIILEFGVVGMAYVFLPARFWKEK